MASKTSDSTRLALHSREPGHSRATRRLRREGLVPGILYGRDLDNLPFAVEALELRRALAKSGAVLELELDGQTTNAVVKDAQKHPVRGDITHLDLVRVDVNKPIEATVTITIIGGDDAPGVIEGGVLSQPVREVLVEALPNDIPESIEFDASALEAGGMAMLSELVAPAGVTLVVDETAAETVLVTITAPSSEEPAEGDEIESETEVVGEGEDAAAAEGGDDSPEASEEA